MDRRQLQGWHADPFGLHEYRYFSAGTPTRLVRDGTVESYDEPPARLLPLRDVADTSHPPPAGSSGSPSDGSAGAAHRLAVAVDQESASVLGYPAGLVPALAAHSDPSDRRRGLSLLSTVIALVSTAAVVAAVAIWAGRDLHQRADSSSPALTVGALVIRSARKTLAQQTAEITVQGAVDVSGSEVQLRGNGQADFTASTWHLNMSWNAAGTTVTENEIATRQDLYFQLTVGGNSIAQDYGGRDWFESPLAVSASQVAPQHSPVWSLQLLEQQGARVVPMGRQTVAGQVCDEYVVTPTKRAMLAAAQREWAELGLSGSEQAAGRQLLANSSTPTFTIWLNPNRQLTCQLDVYLSLGMESAGGSASAPSTGTLQLLMTFTHYGTPVTVRPPPQSDTVSL